MTPPKTAQELSSLPKLEPAQASAMEAAPNHMGMWFVWLDDDTQVFVTKRLYQNMDYVQFRRWGRVVAEYQISNMQHAVRGIVYSLMQQVDQHRKQSAHYTRQPEGRAA